MTERRDLLSTTAIDTAMSEDQIQALWCTEEEVIGFYTSGFWHDMERTIPCKPGMTVAVMEFTHQNGKKTYADQPAPHASIAP